MAAADRHPRTARSSLARTQASRNGRGHVCGALAQMLTAAQEATVRELWGSGISQQEIAYRIGVGRDRLISRLQDQLRDLPRPGRGRSSGGERDRRPRPAPPTPEEIAALAAELRHRWPPERWLPAAATDDDDQPRDYYQHEDPDA